jgi:transposase-like protein
MLPILPWPHGQGTAIVRHGTTRQGQHRSRYREQPCAGRPFLRDDSDPGQAPEVKHQSVEMALKASGLRATARVLPISTKTVMTE